MRPFATLSPIALAVTLLACGSSGTNPTAASPPVNSEGGADASSSTPSVGNDGLVIECGSPTDGAMLNAAPGSSVAFGGTATGPNGVAGVTVNGAPATLSGTGFSTNLTTRFGINFASIVATDTQGVTSTRVCSFLVADQWAPENAVYADTIDLKLTQDAIDEGNRSGGVHSFADVLYAIANTDNLQTEANFGLQVLDPVAMPESCGQEVCTPAVAGIPSSCACAYSAGASVLAVSIPGPQAVSVSLVDGGLAATVTLPTLGINVDLYGTVGPAPFNVPGWIWFSQASIALTLDTTLSNGQLQLSVRPNSVSSSLQWVSTDFPGLAGVLVQNVLPPLNALIQNWASSTLANYANSYLDLPGAQNNGGISSLFSGIVLSTFGTSKVPALDRGSPVPVTFGFGLTSLSTTPTRMLIGIGSQFTTPPTQTLSSLGIAIPDGTVLDDVTVNTPNSAAVAVHVGVLNQALHAAWRGGMFDTTVTSADFGNGLLPAETTVQLVSQLPPVADLIGNSVELSMGGLQLQVTDPGLLAGSDEPLAVELGARLTSTPTLNGDSLEFTTATLTELHFSTGAVSLPPATTQGLQSMLQDLVQQLAIQSLNALPALPVPSFVFPLAPLAQIPDQIGPTDMSLGYDTNDFVLGGQLGLP